MDVEGQVRVSFVHDLAGWVENIYRDGRPHCFLDSLAVGIVRIRSRTATVHFCEAVFGVVSVCVAGILDHVACGIVSV